MTSNFTTMAGPPYFEKAMSFFLMAGKKSRLRTLEISLFVLFAIAVADWAIGNRASLGLLYMLPMVLAAIALSPAQVVLLAILCSGLRSWFDLPAPRLEGILRFVFAFVAYMGSGLFVIALNRNRAAVNEHLSRIRREQQLRQELEEELKTLVESSPAAILTIDRGGAVLAANRAANDLIMLPEGQTLRGRQIGRYLPLLADALQFNPGSEGLRTAAQCQGFREDGEIFLANIWFSSWNTPEGPRLAAIVVDSSEEMRDREEENLRQLTLSNQMAAAAVSHEVRNLCAAISAVSANLSEKRQSGEDEDVRALASLVAGLERIASLELRNKEDQTMLADVALQSVLDDLRIIIEPQWREIDGVVRWSLPPAPLPLVTVERHGLTQAFLNLAQNSHRAVQESSVRELLITVSLEPDNRVFIRFRDSGPGVSAPDRLFAPFQTGADGSGLGLYVSRSLLRSYGGDLRTEPSASGSCFLIDLHGVLEL